MLFCGQKVLTRRQSIAKKAVLKVVRKGISLACAQQKATTPLLHKWKIIHLSFITVSAPGCLPPLVIAAFISGHIAETLMDSESSASFIDTEFYKKIGVPFKKKISRITMASISHAVQIRGQAVINLRIEDREEYQQFSLGVTDKLCADVILGLDILKFHKGVQFIFHGDKSLFQLDSKFFPSRNDACLIMAANVDPPRIFKTIKEDSKPIATKSRRYSREDETFITEEVNKLLQKGVIEPSNSLWRAQILVTKDKRHKRHMVINYSQTVNRFMELVTYPLPGLTTK